MGADFSPQFSRIYLKNWIIHVKIEDTFFLFFFFFFPPGVEDCNKVFYFSISLFRISQVMIQEY